MPEVLPPLPDALTLRDRLIRAFVQAPAAPLVLRSVQGPTAVLTTVQGVPVALHAAVEGEPLDALQQYVGQVLAAVEPGGTLYLMVVGGGESALDRLRQVTPSVQLRRQLNLQHLASDGRLTRLAGFALPGLDAAVACAAADASPVDLQALAAHQSDTLAQEHAFAERMKTQKPIVTWALVGANGVLFLLQQRFGADSHALADARMGVLMQALVLQGEWWRLWASTMLHGNLLHLLFNMAALVSFAPLLETVLGRARFLSLYALSGMGGALLSAALHDQGASLGASGAIWGVMTGGAALVLRPRDLLPPLTRQLMKQRVWVPVGINLLYSFRPGIDLWGHVGGGVVGFLLVLTGLATAGLPGRRNGTGATVVAALLGLGMVASVGLALLTGRPWELARPPLLEPVTLEGTRLTALLPRGMRLTAEAEHPRSFQSGSLLTDPLVLVTTVMPDDKHEYPDADAPKLLLAELERTPVERSKRTQAPNAVDHGGKTWVLDTSERNDGVVVQRGVAKLGADIVFTMVYLHPGASPPWRALASQVVVGASERAP